MSANVSRGRAIADSEGEAASLIAPTHHRFSGVSVAHLKKIVVTALEVIEARALITPETIIIPELGEGSRISRDG